MADDVAGFVLVFLQEFPGRREGNLVDILVHFLLRHTDATVRDLDGLGLVVHIHADGQVAQLTLEFAGSGEGLQLLGGIHRIGHDLAQEDIMVGIQEFFDDRKDIFRCHADFSFRHSYLF